MHYLVATVRHSLMKEQHRGVDAAAGSKTKLPTDSQSGSSRFMRKRCVFLHTEAKEVTDEPDES